MIINWLLRIFCFVSCEAMAYECVMYYRNQSKNNKWGNKFRRIANRMKWKNIELFAFNLLILGLIAGLGGIIVLLLGFNPGYVVCR